MNRTTTGWDRLLWPAVFLLAATVVLFQFTNLDLAVQDRFFDFSTRSWIIDGENPVGRFFFYNGPKATVIVFGVILLGLALGPPRWRQACGFERRDLWVAVLTVVALPLLVAGGKVVTNVVCPKDVRRYGGAAPYVKLCSPYAENDPPPAGGRCFPAAHASGAFALVGSVWLRRTRRWQLSLAVLGLCLGWATGFYQIIKGSHYLSDTIATMCLAWIVALTWRRILRAAPVSPG